MATEPRSEKTSSASRTPLSDMQPTGAQSTTEKVTDAPEDIINQTMPTVTENALRPEKVSAIMVIDQKPRIRLARVAVESFVRQTYTETELVIINGTGENITTREHPQINEIAVMGGSSIGALRNVGIENATGDWLMTWDDDNWSHPHRIGFQMAYRIPGASCMLRYETRVDVLRSFVVPFEEINGIPGTIMWPKGDYRYTEDADVREDRIFAQNFGDNRVVVINDSTWFPGPVLQASFFHGNNVLSEEEFFSKAWSGSEHSGKWLVRPDEQEYLKTILGFYGMSATDTDGTGQHASELAALRERAGDVAETKKVTT